MLSHPHHSDIIINPGRLSVRTLTPVCQVDVPFPRSNSQHDVHWPLL